MSHFSVCVIVPDDGVVNNIHANNLEDHLIPVLAPFDEQTEEEKYREFEDRTEEAKADFENDTMRVVRFPDGSIHSIYDDAFNKFFFVEEDKIYAFGPNRDRKSKLQTEESKALELVTDYPVKSWYPSFEAYCDEHRGFVKASDGQWGYGRQGSPSGSRCHRIMEHYDYGYFQRFRQWHARFYDATVRYDGDAEHADKHLVRRCRCRVDELLYIYHYRSLYQRTDGGTYTGVSRKESGSPGDENSDNRCAASSVCDIGRHGSVLLSPCAPSGVCRE